MGETVKFNKFCSEDMGNKSVSEIPGVGGLSARKLKSIGYSKATDVYDKLKKLNFDEKKFKVWMSLNCPGARVSIIYRALCDWNNQFGAEGTSGVNSDGRVYDASTSGGGGGADTKSPAKRRRVSFAPSPKPHDKPSTSSETSLISNTNNSLLNFLTSFSGIVQNISTDLHTQFMLDILNVMKQYENKSKEKEAAAPPADK